MMGIFKGLFSKLGKKSSQNSEDEVKLQAYIVIGVDEDEDNFISCNFIPDCEKKMAELIFLLYSGNMMEECIESLKKACNSEEESQTILQNVAVLLQEFKSTQQPQLKPSAPVVDPCEVFKTGDRNEFRG